MKRLVLSLGIAILATCARGQESSEPATAFTDEEPSFGFWVSTVECKDANAKPVFSFNKVMRCGCAVGTKYVGPCFDLGQEVLGLPKADVERLAKEMQTKSPAPTPAEQCQTIPRVFLDSGTGDSGANFDELYDAAMNSACSEPDFEWRARDCRDSFIPGKGAEGFTGVQDRANPYCTLECESLFLEISISCPRVYELLNLGQFADLCPGLRTVQIPTTTTPVAVAPGVEEILAAVPDVAASLPVVPNPDIAVPPAVAVVEPPAGIAVVEPPAVAVPVAVAPEAQPSSAAAAYTRVGVMAIGAALALY